MDILIPDDLTEILIANYCLHSSCGSRVTCNPPPTDTDIDYLIFCNEPQLSVFHDCLDDYGFVRENGQHYEDASDCRFTSFRKGKLNFIVTGDIGFVETHKFATRVCKELNLMEKSHRVTLFQALLHGVFLPKEGQ